MYKSDQLLNIYTALGLTRFNAKNKNTSMTTIH